MISYKLIELTYQNKLEAHEKQKNYLTDLFFKMNLKVISCKS
jgi:hypothetical protein